MVYFNVTSNVGVVWSVGTSTVGTTATFTIEGQSLTNQLLLRNLWIPDGASTDIYISMSTGSNSTTLIMSGVASSFNSFSWFISSSTQTITLKNNSNNTAVYGADGVVLRT